MNKILPILTQSNTEILPKIKSNHTMPINKKSGKAAILLALMALASANVGTVYAQSKKTQNTAKNPIVQTINPETEIINIYGKYGEYYVKNIPDKENIALHANALNRLSKACETIQGCEFKNPALFNGLSAEDLIKKVVEPTEKLARGEKIGANQNTLVAIIQENSCDRGEDFIDNFNTNVFANRTPNISGVFNYKYDEAFYEHYDNIIPIQANKLSADSVLNNAFGALQKGLDNGADVDIMFLAHGYISRNGAILSTGGNNTGAKKVTQMDIADFKSVEKGGEIYSQYMKTILENSVKNGNSPRIIGIGCNSDFIQKALDGIISPEYINKMKVFGTPYSTNNRYVAGFNDGKFESSVLTSSVASKTPLLLHFTENSTKSAQKVDTFILSSNDIKILLQNAKNSNNKGSLTKDSGATMEYKVYWDLYY